MIGENQRQDLTRQPAQPTKPRLPDDPGTDRIAAGDDPAEVAATFPASSAPWAALAEAALRDGRTIEAYAFARTGAAGLLQGHARRWSLTSVRRAFRACPVGCDMDRVGQDRAARLASGGAAEALSSVEKIVLSLARHTPRTGQVSGAVAMTVVRSSTSPGSSSGPSGRIRGGPVVCASHHGRLGLVAPDEAVDAEVSRQGAQAGDERQQDQSEC